MHSGQLRASCYGPARPFQSLHIRAYSRNQFLPIKQPCGLRILELRGPNKRHEHSKAAHQSCVCSATGPQQVSAQDRQHMKHALTLAKKGLGNTYPNPAVGCVIVDQGKVVGEGFHPKAGEPHAEVFALRAAGQRAKGATAYVTLEPCNHYGKTPPCSQALVDAQVAKVFVGVRDPNPLVNNAGVDTLTRAGIDVVYIGGEEERECYDINADFMARMSHKPTAACTQGVKQDPSRPCRPPKYLTGLLNMLGYEMSFSKQVMPNLWACSQKGFQNYTRYSTCIVLIQSHSQHVVLTWDARGLH
ncbi:hypothetical protein ABBQ38_006901 [Trebouxia sp. C0009 RCD-2024]